MKSPKTLIILALILAFTLSHSADAACYLNDTSTDVTRVLTNSDKGDITSAAFANRDITSCDVSGMTDMSELFMDANNFNQDISNWDVSNVTNMFRMFNNAFIFNQDISGWNVSSATNMVKMFKKAYKFNQDLSPWNVTNIPNKPREFDNRADNWTKSRPIWGTNAGISDTISPTITITAANSDGSVTSGTATDDSSLAVTFTLSEASTDFAEADITVRNGRLSNWNAVSSTIYTATLTPSAAGSVTINVAAATFTDSAGNDNTAATEFSLISDTTAPTIAITASNNDGSVASGSATDDSSLTVTFTLSEASTDFSETDVTVSNGSLSNWNAVSSSVYTATLTPAAIGTVTVDVSAATFSDSAGNDNTAATQFTWSFGNDPTSKADVIGTVESATNLAVNFTKTSLRSINSRFRWLRRNAESDNKSHQGVKVTFANKYLDEVVNGSSTGFGEIKLADAADFAKDYGMNQGDVMSDVGGKLIRTAAAEVREQTGVNLNPTGGTLIGNWSIWTEGQISVGKIDKTASTARQDSDSFAITVGIDRPYWDDGVIGIAATLGRDDVDIGESGSDIESDNYSINLYSGFIPDNFTPMEVSLGFAHMQMDNTRVDGDQTLKGDRDANAIIGSVKAYAESMTRGNFTITPYGQVELSHIKLKQYSESGGTMALTYEEQRINRGMVFIGTEFDYVTNLGKGKLRPFGAIEYGYDFSGSSDADMRYVGSSTNYRMTLDKISSSRWMARIGSDYNIKDDLTASIAYEREEMIGAGHNHNIRASISAAF